MEPIVPTYIIDLAQTAFWMAVAGKLSHVKSGDLPPAAQRAFDDACKTAIQTWLKHNTPATPLDVLSALGFEPISTGGGCKALSFVRPDGQECLVTSEADLPRPGESWDVGFYTSTEEKVDGGCLSVEHYPADNLNAALAAIAEWRVG